MAVEFRCTQCNRLLRVGDDAAGRQAKCPECGAILSVPQATPEPAVPPPSSQAGSPFTPGGPKPAATGQAQNPYQAPGQYGRPPQPGQPPVAGFVPNYLVQAILCTLFCCLPLGIVAIVFAAQVNGKLAAGDYHGAVSASNTARTWCWVSFWLGIVPLILWLLMVMLMGIA